nr:hypothetical protein Ade03nite_93430 [Actinoplanes derwentensis]
MSLGALDWNADTDFDVRLQDVPLNNLRPGVAVYRAGTIDLASTRPEDVLLVVEVASRVGDDRPDFQS